LKVRLAIKRLLGGEFDSAALAPGAIDRYWITDAAPAGSDDRLAAWR